MKVNLYPFLFLTALASCNMLNYDPIRNDDVPPSPAEPWERHLGICEAKKCCFELSELSEAMPLSKLLDIALFNNPRTQVSWQAARAAAFGVKVAYSPFFPSVSFVETLERDDNTVGASNRVDITTTSSGASAAVAGTTVETLTTQLIISYLLFDFGGRQSQVDFAAGALFAANWQHNLDIQQVILNVLNSYTLYLGNEGLVFASTENIKDAEVALKASEKLHQAGLVTQTDVLQSQANLSQRKLDLIQAEGNRDTALGQLIVTIGLPPETELTVENLPQRLPIVDISGNIAELFELAKTRRPDLGIALAAIKQQEAQLGISFSNSMPQINTVANFSYTHFIHTPRLDGHDNNLTINLTAPIFQGFYYVNQRKQLRAQIAQAVASLNLQVTQVALDIVTSYYALKTATEKIPVAEVFVDASERAYKGLIAQYKVGTSSIIDVLNASTILSNARAAVITARTDWAASRANLGFSVGILDDLGPQWGNEIEYKTIDRGPLEKRNN